MILHSGLDSLRGAFLLSVLLPFAAVPARAQEQAVAPLPPGVTLAWDVGSAYRESTPTREKLCINGLWRWQPATLDAQTVPVARWGFFKVPGQWPGITDYMQKDFQTVIGHPSWKDERLGSLLAAWYQREISIPPEWVGRRVALSADFVNSVALVFIDGKKHGEIRFPGGDLDLTATCQPGSSHVLSVLVLALPLKGVLLSYTDTNTAREVKGRVARRGLCGDVFLVSMPAIARLADVRVETSVRRREITVDVGLEELPPERRYAVEVQILRAGQPATKFSSATFSRADLVENRLRFAHAWMPDALWDLHTPENTYVARFSLVDDGGRVADGQHDVRFGFREFWIEGRDFFLNGSRIGLSAVPLDNAQVGAALANYDGARESLLRLKSIGINFVYTHNYGCEPGSHLSFAEILRAADDVGMLVALSQPHFSHYDWKAAEAARNNGYARHAEYYVRTAQNHPAVVAYSMNHNATGYAEDMNPDMIDGLQDPRDARAKTNAKLALGAEAIVRHFDPSRVIYHHSSGNLGSMHTINFYTNFVPPQELSDWFEHWATVGVKPVFLCEYGAPFSWDWTMYRGWYKGERAFGSAEVPWEFSVAEWNAQFFGDRAYAISAPETANLRWEARQMAAGKVWHRWDYPYEVGSTAFDERFPVYAKYLADNWPAFRTWGASAISPWEFGHFWKLRPGVDKKRQELPVEWASLQRPGFSPDFIATRYERMDLAFNRDDWIPTVAAQALLRYNQPLLAYIAGKPAAFTSKDHVFNAGETIEKQIIVINNSRENVTCDVDWSFASLPRASGKTHLTLPAGAQERVPLRIALPASIAPGEYPLNASARFSNEVTQTDSFRVHVATLSAPLRPSPAKIALFDPKGETSVLLKRLGVVCEAVGAEVDLANYTTLIVGKQALSSGGSAPNIARLRDGLKVIVFEQTSEVLEKRFGFRVAEYGLRNVFPRMADHAALAGIDHEQLRDWRGEATLLSPRLQYETRPRYGPIVKWCDIPVTRLWRCGNRGNVASVLMEKPARGDFRSIVDGGFDLQYSALLEYREGAGMILFCQLDVSGRTEPEPTADVLVKSMLQYIAAWKPSAMKRAIYLGEAAGKHHLEEIGVAAAGFRGAPLGRDDVLIVGPNVGSDPLPSKSELADWMKTGGRVIAVGLGQADVDALLPQKIGLTNQEHIATYFEPREATSAFAGIGPADVFNRAPQKIPLVATGAALTGDGVLATTDDGRIVFCQLVPWHFEWRQQRDLKRTFRTTTRLLTRILSNQGVASAAPIVERFTTAVVAGQNEKRWSSGLYLDAPDEWDDPYRFFRW